MVKLKINTSASALAAAAAAEKRASSPKTTTPKIKLKTKSTVPTLKLKSFSQASGSAAVLSPAIQTPLRTPILKLKTPKQPAVRKRRHEPGNGYDSEASDREDDPAIEEQFILRMPPGDDCDYLRAVIEKKELNPTSDVWFKFKDSRRAVVCVRGNLYSALLVDLPSVIESNKTLDKKAIFKTADICQMLLVSERIKHEDESFNLLTRPQDITYPHGLTPPMHFVRKRRFRKRISNRTIEAVEAEVDRLLRDDERAEKSSFSLVDAAELARAEEGEEEGYDLLGGQDYDDEQDAEGEVEYDYAPGEEMDDDTLANDLESALMDDMGDLDDTPPVPGVRTIGPGGTIIDDESDDDDEDEDEEPELDEDAAEAAQEKEKLREEIQDLEETIKAKEKEYESLSNVMLKARIQKVILNLRSELELKMGQGQGQ
ncbi:hypothetical protein Q9L58_003033 [Maublancomyces gigas]|uniref:TAFII55 protein conserved region domain-containing protein n=1 Tax=Discina gigas TaxID=1032678 RepID=A0ABR3GPV6_9PEZI